MSYTELQDGTMSWEAIAFKQYNVITIAEFKIHLFRINTYQHLHAAERVWCIRYHSHTQVDHFNHGQPIWVVLITKVLSNKVQRFHCYQPPFIQLFFFWQIIFATWVFINIVSSHFTKASWGFLPSTNSKIFKLSAHSGFSSDNNSLNKHSGCIWRKRNSKNRLTLYCPYNAYSNG